MILSATRADAARSRRHYVSPHGAHSDVETYMGMNKALLGDAQVDPAVADPAIRSPNAYLVSQAPGAELRAHFHAADQFQVIVGGSGRIGTHEVRAVTVHFAAAHSAYGPVAAGPEGLEYLTLRPAWDAGAQWMPEGAQRLRSMQGRRHMTYTSEPFPAHTQSMPLAEASAVTTLLQDGLTGAWVVDLRPGVAWRRDAKADHFVYLLDGSAEVHGVAMEPQGCLFAGAEEEALFLAGPFGARVLVAQFGGHELGD